MKQRNSEFALARSAGALRTKVIRNKRKDLPRKAKHKGKNQ